VRRKPFGENASLGKTDKKKIDKKRLREVK
jgi:hypothetical protein